MLIELEAVVTPESLIVCDPGRSAVEQLQTPGDELRLQTSVVLSSNLVIVTEEVWIILQINLFFYFDFVLLISQIPDPRGHSVPVDVKLVLSEDWRGSRIGQNHFEAFHVFVVIQVWVYTEIESVDYVGLGKLRNNNSAAPAIGVHCARELQRQFSLHDGSVLFEFCLDLGTILHCSYDRQGLGEMSNVHIWLVTFPPNKISVRREA